MLKTNNLLTIERLEEHKEHFSEIKDPSVVCLPDETYMMYASVGSSVNQKWIVGRFISNHPAGPWKEVEPVEFIGLSGPQLCAPAVTYEETENGTGKWVMYIQTACFEDNGVIAEAVSYDGQIFAGVSASLISRDDVEKDKHPVVGVYDVGISEANVHGEERLVMLFSGYRKVGCGDIYMSYKNKNDMTSEWSKAKCVLAQEDVPFHNKPGDDNFEWGLEGAKIIQIAPECFLMIGVCFLPLPDALGKRQRVFFSASSSIHGPFIPLGVPFEPQENEFEAGEHGHPDTIVIGNDLWVIYQERKADGQPWHLRYAIIDLTQFATFASNSLSMRMNTQPLPQTYL